MNGAISYLRRRPCHRGYLGARANLCLPSLPAHRGVQSSRSNLGDPTERKQEGTNKEQSATERLKFHAAAAAARAKLQQLLNTDAGTHIL